MNVFWSMLFERYVSGELVGNMMDIAATAFSHGCNRIPQDNPGRTDMTRNYIVKTFMAHSTSDEDVVVMLDNDHRMPRNVVSRLALQVDAEHEVVGALAFWRSPPHIPCYFTRSADGKGLDVQLNFDHEGPLIKCLIVGTGAIAIRRSVFRKLEAAGLRWPYFRYTYNEDSEIQRTEDFEFGLLCEQVGVPHWVDQSFFIPHQTTKYIGLKDCHDFAEEVQREPDRYNARFSSLSLSYVRSADGNGTVARHTDELPPVPQLAGTPAVADTQRKRRTGRRELRPEQYSNGSGLAHI